MRIGRARTEIFEFKLRVRLLRVRMQVASSFLERQFRQFVRAFAVLLESFVLFRGYRFTEFDVSRTSNFPFTAHEQWHSNMKYIPCIPLSA